MKRIRDIQPGDSLTLTRVIDRYRPMIYGAVGNDLNPIHIDPDFAREAGLGGNILHGMCTYAMALSAVTRFVGDPARVVGSSGRFSCMVRPGDTLSLTATVASIDGRRVRFDLDARNQKGEAVLTGAFAEAELDA